LGNQILAKKKEKRITDVSQAAIFSKQEEYKVNVLIVKCAAIVPLDRYICGR
jgi:hypothetical protein